MPTTEQFRALALAFPETTEEPHFDITSFRVAKKIFATMNAKENRCTLRLSEVDQSVFTAMAPGVVYKVPNKWGSYGWTNVDLPNVDPELLHDALTTAYCTVAPKRLAVLFTGDDEHA
jgi:hypothetical protein